jgi:hypothetical protein
MGDTALLVWLERLMNFSALLVALGVTGEFVGNWVANPIRNRINAGKDAEIARFNKDASDAHKAASEAIERAAALAGCGKIRGAGGRVLTPR